MPNIFALFARLKWGNGAGASSDQMTVITDPFTLSETNLEEIREHAVAAYPNEACGVLVRMPDGRPAVRRMANIQEEMHAKLPEHFTRTAKTAYCWDQAEIDQLEELRASGDHKLLAIYHSHPDHGAYFSDTDQAAATPFGEPTYPEAVQLVISVVEAEPREFRIFSWSEAEHVYVEVPVTLLD